MSQAVPWGLGLGLQWHGSWQPRNPRAEKGPYLKTWSWGRAAGLMASGSFSLFSSRMAWKETRQRQEQI